MRFFVVSLLCSEQSVGEILLFVQNDNREHIDRANLGTQESEE
jgi:hypothetical protein